MLDYKIVGTKIASFRKKNELSQERLAELLNISPQAISKWENGHSLPDTALLPVLSQIFSCTIDELIMPAYLLDSRIEEEKQTF
ncbi:MAG TPA: helix-turn-helix transcriptional regulator [Oscillospiraceae bacterium]|nr:helix-turn-helix transcriptional regulator [Oscillospiraceae bacterium]HPS34555.1 helix-turn-helix transcriptional regulator [Oscillospiraceae bacterium]